MRKNMTNVQKQSIANFIHAWRAFGSNIYCSLYLNTTIVSYVIQGSTMRK